METIAPYSLGGLFILPLPLDDHDHHLDTVGPARNWEAGGLWGAM